MTARKFAWKYMIALTLALSACAGPQDASGGGSLETSAEGAPEVRSSALSIDAGQFPLMIGDVVANHGHSYLFEASGGAYYFGSHSWDTCPDTHSLIGHVFDENGFWLCARPDLASRTFYVGDVEGNYGYYYRVTTSGVTQLASQSWDTCVNGSTFLGRWFDQAGFWVCMSPQ